MPPKGSKRNHKSRDTVSSSDELSDDSSPVSTLSSSISNKSSYEGVYVGISRHTFHVLLTNFPTGIAPAREAIFNLLFSLNGSYKLIVSYGSKHTPESNQIEIFQRFGQKVNPKEYMQKLKEINGECEIEMFITKKEDASINSVSRADYNLMFKGVNANDLS